MIDDANQKAFEKFVKLYSYENTLIRTAAAKSWQSAHAYNAPYRAAVNYMYDHIGRNYGSMEPIDAAKAWMKDVLDNIPKVDDDELKKAISLALEEVHTPAPCVVDQTRYVFREEADAILTLLKARGIV